MVSTPTRIILSGVKEMLRGRRNCCKSTYGLSFVSCGFLYTTKFGRQIDARMKFAESARR
jgi:hypothetical protein